MVCRVGILQAQSAALVFGPKRAFATRPRRSKLCVRGYATRFGYAVARCLTFANYGQPEKVLSVADQPRRYQPGTAENTAVAGNEGLVQIVSRGSKVNPSIRVGQWALMANPSFGTWRTYALAKESDLIMIPNREGLSPVDAATVSVNPSTAYRMLQDFGNLQEGDYFIQNAANSSVGKSAIQIAKIWGFHSINIVRDRPNIEELKEELLSLGGTVVLTEEEVRDKARVSKITGGKPIKLALNCVGGKSAMNIARLLG
ncbi:hypothetical protein AA313_de0209658 [Arthrobotrys entomopaga]|nr:hypothetical protein AA313_de0209658 [Arthrobotrys entomopaga]